MGTGAAAGARGSAAAAARGSVLEQARQLFAAAPELPEAIVVDLDYTVWECWCECYSAKDPAPVFPEVAGILAAARGAGLKLAVASRTPTPPVARAWLAATKLGDLFDNVQLVPSAMKDVVHLPNIRDALGVGYESMLFFDDEAPNVRRATKNLGVASVLVPEHEGVSLRTLKLGLDLWLAAKTQRQRQQQEDS